MPFVVIDKNEERVERAMKLGMLGVAADASSDETLRDVGIDKASGLIATLASDADNLFLTLSAKSLNSRLCLSARVDEEASEQKMRRAGADFVFAPYNSTGHRMAQALRHKHRALLRGLRHLRGIAARNASAEDFACFLGAGSYDHSVPSPINHLISRGEFFTAYTPYQPEASQGTLRSIFEYQSMMAELTGMDVANASLYDGASSVAEAALMAHAVTERNAVVLSKGVNPLYRQVVETYCEGPGIRLKSAPIGDGATDLDALRKAVGSQTAAVVIQHPNFFGCLEDVKAAADIATNSATSATLTSTSSGPDLTLGGIKRAVARLTRG